MERSAALAACVLTGLLACDAGETAPAAVPGLHLVEVARFGSLDSGGSALSSVRSLALTDSTVLVLEDRPPRLAVFGFDGGWHRDIGREGDGPGEYVCPSRVGIHDGDVWVSDACGGRLETYSPDGTPRRSHRWHLTPDSTEETPLPRAILEDGSILAHPRDFIRARPVVRPYYRATPAGERLGLLYRWTQSELDVLTGSIRGQMFFGIHPLPVSPLVDLFSDGRGLLVVDRLLPTQSGGTAFRMRVLVSDDSTGLDVRVPYTPRSAEGWFDRFVELREIDDEETADAFRDAAAGRELYPPVSAVVAGADHSIWIRREGLLGDSATWQVFGPTGELVGELATPANLEILLPSLVEVWAVERTELDVPFVVRFRLESERE